MDIDRSSKLPLYLQIKHSLKSEIEHGTLKPGDLLPTEAEFCALHSVSRDPVRHAMEELVAEGFLVRTRGRGTFVAKTTPRFDGSHIGLVMPALKVGLCGDILTGFEREAASKGFLVSVCSSEYSVETEMVCVDKLVRHGVSGLFVFPCESSRLGEKLPELRDRSVYAGIVDRNPGIGDIDYVGSDNSGGGYTAVRHLAMHGFRNLVLVSEKFNVSSIDERVEGFLQAAIDYRLEPLERIDTDESYSSYRHPAHRFFVERLRESLAELKRHVPLGIFAVNDWVAMRCIKIVQDEGLVVGRDVGIVGFDNESECDFAPVPLTSVAQNGILLGRTAADLAMGTYPREPGTRVKVMVPTQLVVRRSCGEHRDS